jgi:hypothetical protein
MVQKQPLQQLQLLQKMLILMLKVEHLKITQ